MGKIVWGPDIGKCVGYLIKLLCPKCEKPRYVGKSIKYVDDVKNPKYTKQLCSECYLDTRRTKTNDKVIWGPDIGKKERYYVKVKCPECDELRYVERRKRHLDNWENPEYSKESCKKCRKEDSRLIKNAVPGEYRDGEYMGEVIYGFQINEKTKYLIWIQCKTCKKYCWVAINKETCKICSYNENKPFYSRRKQSKGYNLIKLPNDDTLSEMCNDRRVNSVWVLEHRYVMAKHLGRVLKISEQVHHKDGNRQNNDIDNLELCLIGEHIIGQRIKDYIPIELKDILNELEEENKVLRNKVKNLYLD